jgi:hypothetical protein
MTQWSGEGEHCACPEANTCRACPDDCKECTWDVDCECYAHQDGDDPDWQAGDITYGGIVSKDQVAASRRRDRCPDCGGEGWIHIGGPDSVPCATCKVPADRHTALGDARRLGEG